MSKLATGQSPTLPITQRMARLVPQPENSPSPPQEVVHISSFAIIRDGERILLTKRLRPQFTAGKWILPSSLIDYGEDPEGAIKRIVEVQLGTRPDETKLIQVQSYGGSHWDIFFVYEVKMRRDATGRPSQEIDAVQYFDPGKLPEELRADHREVLQTARLL